MTAPLISVRNFSVAFTQCGKTTTAVDHISFDIMPGEMVALVFIGEAVRDAFDPRKAFK